MTKRQSWPRFFVGWIRQLGRDATKSARHLIKFRRDRRHRLVIAINRPRFAASRWYWRRRWRQPPVITQALKDLLGLGLITLSMVGLLYLTEPFRVQPIFSTGQVINQTIAAESPKPESSPAIQRSLPTRIKIATLGVDSQLVQLGRQSDGSMATPKQPKRAGWYKYSPTPGEVGPSVIVGHVDSDSGPAVFYDLRKLKPGQLVYVDRRDGSRIEFAVYKVANYSQQRFPTKLVYGNTKRPELRLITCGGSFNYLTGHYTENTVVFAKAKL